MKSKEEICATCACIRGKKNYCDGIYCEKLKKANNERI